MLQPAELEALAGKALKAALAEEQYQRGVIIDGLNSQYLTLDTAANLLLSSLGLEKSCKFRAFCYVTGPAAAMYHTEGCISPQHLGQFGLLSLMPCLQTLEPIAGALCLYALLSRC